MREPHVSTTYVNLARNSSYVAARRCERPDAVDRPRRRERPEERRVVDEHQDERSQICAFFVEKKRPFDILALKMDAEAYARLLYP